MKDPFIRTGTVVVCLLAFSFSSFAQSLKAPPESADSKNRTEGYGILPAPLVTIMGGTLKVATHYVSPAQK